jgi:hypothetical protein
VNFFRECREAFRQGRNEAHAARAARLLDSPEQRACSAGNGRKVHGLYGFDPVTRLPRALSLFIMTKDHVGYPKAVVANYDVTGYLGNSELLEYAETLDRRAAALELGIPSAPSVIQIDLTNPNRA